MPAERFESEVDLLTPERAREVFDEAARFYLGMGGEEFVRKWEAGEFEDPDRHPVMTVAMLLPLWGQPVGG